MSKKVTLQEPQSRGGEIAEGGFEFQNNVILSFIPQWLNDSSFSGFIREAMGDFEIKFFNPNNDSGYIFDFVEAKDHIVSPKEFWKEIKRFMEMDSDNSGLYRYFIISSTGTAPTLSPIMNSLRRIKNPYSFYGQDSLINKSSYEAFEDRVIKENHTLEEAKFLFNKVIVKDNFGAMQTQGEAIFIQSLSENLKGFNNLPHKVNQKIFSSLKNFIGKKCNVLIKRQEFENDIISCVDQNGSSLLKVPEIYTCIDDSEQDGCINLKWEDFWGGDQREYPHSDIWNKKMLKQLKKTREWIAESYNDRKIILSGNRRLSTTIAIGTEFSATTGFNIDFNYRGEIWTTNKHAINVNENYDIKSKIYQNYSKDVIVSIGIIHEISSEIKTFLNSSKMMGLSNLHIFGKEPIISPEQANFTVQKIKKTVNDFLVESGGNRIHLFFAGPSFLALFLGHRLNATANIQCYERISPNNYQPTCLLKCN